MIKYINFILFLLMFILSAKAQNLNQDVINYINQYKDIAIVEMKVYKIPASITLAQGILESAFGKSELALKSNNHFGIKCKVEWTGKTTKHDDDAPNECFRVYDSVEESYRDHSKFLAERSRYAKLFTYDIKDYKSWAYGLKEAGYATNPKYPQLLIKYIEDYNLYVFDDGNIANDNIYATKNEPQFEETINKSQQEISLIEETNKVLEVEDASTHTIIKNKIYSVNNIKAVKLQKGQSVQSIANKENISLSKLLAYNDAKSVNDFKEDDLVFLSKKKKKGKQQYYKVKAGDTPWSIAQKNGMKLKNLLKYNHIAANQYPAPNEKLYLQRKSPKQPKLTDKITVPINVPEKEMPKPEIKQEQEKIKETPKIITEKIQSKPSVMPNELLLFNIDKDYNSTKKSTTENQSTTNTIVENSKAIAEYHLVTVGDTLYSISKKYNISVEDLKTINELSSNSIDLGQILKIRK
ncbi:MAG: LysM peptidoglycan-binding domain-containing protein [Chitinophagales bacterium]|nr:LysM peptidoglycan-binding domain-containing protein [Chitinophagales bacterium]